MKTISQTVSVRYSLYEVISASRMMEGSNAWTACLPRREPADPGGDQPQDQDPDHVSHESIIYRYVSIRPISHVCTRALKALEASDTTSHASAMTVVSMGISDRIAGRI